MANFNSSLFAAGPYDGVFGTSTVTLGLMTGAEQSPMVEIQRHGQLINNTHKFGRTPIGQINQGAEAFFSAILQEYNTSLLALLWNYPDATVSIGKMPAIGTDDVASYAQPVVLTRQGTTLATTTGPATITMSRATMVEDFFLRYVFGPILREMPIRMRLYPSDPTALLFFAVT